MNRIIVASSCDNYKLVYINGYCVARVKNFEDIDINKMDKERKDLWFRISEKQRRKIKDKIKLLDNKIIR